jgi:hypothetical protein
MQPAESTDATPKPASIEQFVNENNSVVDSNESAAEIAELKPKNYALLSVIGLLSFIPLGLISQYYAFKVDNFYYQGELVKARKASRRALFYAVSGIVMGFGFTIVILLGIIWVFFTVYEALTSISSAGIALEILQNFLPQSGGISPEGPSELTESGILDGLSSQNKEMLELLEQLNK